MEETGDRQGGVSAGGDGAMRFLLGCTATTHITLKCFLKWPLVTGVINIQGQGFSSRVLLTLRVR